MRSAFALAIWARPALRRYDNSSSTFPKYESRWEDKRTGYEECLSMTIVYRELDFSLTNRLLVVSWPKKGIKVSLELNESRDCIDWSSVTGADTPEKKHIAELMKS